MDLFPADIEFFKSVQEHASTSTLSETVKRAMRVYDYFLWIEAQKGTVTVEFPGKPATHVKII